MVTHHDWIFSFLNSWICYWAAKSAWMQQVSTVAEITWTWIPSFTFTRSSLYHFQKYLEWVSRRSQVEEWIQGEPLRRWARKGQSGWRSSTAFVACKTIRISPTRWRGYQCVNRVPLLPNLTNSSLGGILHPRFVISFTICVKLTKITTPYVDCEGDVHIRLRTALVCYTLSFSWNSCLFKD